MIDWWNLQPEWLKRLRLFASIVWRPYESTRMDWHLSWAVAKCIYPLNEQARMTDGSQQADREN